MEPSHSSLADGGLRFRYEQLSFPGLRPRPTGASPTLDLAPLPDVGAATPWVVEVQDEEGARSCVLAEAHVVVGSAPGADLVVADGAVSGRHCVLSPAGSVVRVFDGGSRNGTYVGAARVVDALAAAGTVLVVGRSTLTLRRRAPEREEDGDVAPLPGLAGKSPAMRRIAGQVRRLAVRSSPVLVAGESGTGKENVARALHSLGPRAGKPFVAVNVAALPRELVESEMFGHERGAFTGAVGRRPGAFEEAEGGTLFLDEIGELPLDAQPKLLRALDGYEVRRVGSLGSGRRFDVRLVAATHVRLADRVAQGLFRRDLFHRLEVFVVEVPALRDRKGDVAAIARALLRQAHGELGPVELTSHAVARLVAHDWPGNVRELRNVLYRAADAAEGRALLEASHIDGAIGGARGQENEVFALTPASARALFTQHRGNLSAAARAAGCPRTSFRKLLRRDEGGVDDAPE